VSSTFGSFDEDRLDAVRARVLFDVLAKLGERRGAIMCSSPRASIACAGCSRPSSPRRGRRDDVVAIRDEQQYWPSAL